VSHARQSGRWRHAAVVVAVSAVVVLAGCDSVPILPGVTPYRIDIQQGNVVTQEMVSRLKPGMTKSQVRFALGSPLITDVFHPERWDYVYLMQRPGKPAEQRRIVVVFEGDGLKRVDGDVVVGPATGPTDRGNAAAPPAAGGSVDAGRAATPAGAPPSTASGTAVPDAPRPDASGPASDKKDEKGFFGRMLEKIGL
jgi:outer membrane protein assembly factor BamE